MKIIKNFENFLNEDYTESAENQGRYDQMTDLLVKANVLVSKYRGEDPEEFEISDPDEALDLLSEIEEDSELYDEAQELQSEIGELSDKIDEMDAEDFYDEDETNESVGELEDSFVDVNIDETELETSDRPNLGKLKQKPGKIIIETPSKTDAYNAKMRLGGDVIQEPGFSDKQIHHVKSTKEAVDFKEPYSDLDDVLDSAKNMLDSGDFENATKLLSNYKAKYPDVNKDPDYTEVSDKWNSFIKNEWYPKTKERRPKFGPEA